jgi:hypothetical protein
MVQAGPDGQARIVTHEYQYVVSDEWIEEQVDDIGVEPPKVWHIVFELRDLPNRNVRRRARELREQWERIPEALELPEPTEDPETFLELLDDWIREWKHASADRAREQAAEQSRGRLLQRQFESDMDDWIEGHGSPRLRLARERGYKVTSAYAKERAARELPESWIDTADRATWRERVDPSLEALQHETLLARWMADRGMTLSIQIVWLVEPPSSMAEMLERGTADEPFGVEFDQQEVLLIAGYLGKYNAFFPIDRDERAPVPDDIDKVVV